MGEDRDGVDKIEAGIGVAQRGCLFIGIALNEMEVLLTPGDCLLVHIRAEESSQRVAPSEGEQRASAATAEIENAARLAHRPPHPRERRLDVCGTPLAYSEETLHVCGAMYPRPQRRWWQFSIGGRSCDGGDGCHRFRAASQAIYDRAP